jgi:putative hydrolase of the HAD superfamily
VAAPVLLFDLDETLYSRQLGVVPRIDGRINDYLRLRVGIPEAEVDAVRRRFWADHGTTLGGLMAHHRVDPDDYLEYVHDVDLSDLLAADSALDALLGRLAARKVIFTNASRAHAARVLGLLGVARAFDRVIALEDRGYVPKPELGAYHSVLAAIGVPAASCWLVDDARRNLAPARALGMRTIWIADAAEEDGDFDHVVASLSEIERLLAPCREAEPRARDNVG